MESEKPSLLNPDFSGLFSVSHLHNKEGSITKCIFSFIANFIVLFSWIFGYALVLVNLAQLYYGYYRSFALLAIFLYTPYLIQWPRVPAFARFLMNGAYYFEGGCSWSFECAPPQYKHHPKQIETPQMFCYHPHGVFTLGFIWNGGIRMSAAGDVSISAKLRSGYVGDKMAHISNIPRHGMAASALIYAPLFKALVVDLCGCVAAAKKQNFLYFMKNRISFGMTPGGFHEISLFERSNDCIYIKHKKGFIKYALQYGYEIFPAYTFGECETYWKLDGIFSAETKQWMDRMHIPTSLLFRGQYWWIPFLPYSSGVGLHTIVGQGIECPRIEKPTQQEIDEYHAKYLEAVVQLFERNKWRFGLKHKTLQVY